MNAETIARHQTIVSNGMQMAPTIPVLVIEDADTAEDVAKALVQGGLRVLEVTLRTPHALAAMERMAKIDGAVVASGTCKSAEDLTASKDAGAQFAVSPGVTETLLAASLEVDLPLLPGSDNVSTSMMLLEHGVTHQKFFPATASGGVSKIKAIGGPLPQIKFCPTGGVTEATAKDFLALSNVLCVGGSWLAPADLVADKNWTEIERRASVAAQF